MIRNLLILIFLTILMAENTNSIECYMIGKTPAGTGMGMYPMGNQGQRAQCSPQVSQCYKYVCTGAPANPFYMLKGCLDYTNPTLSCTTMDAECRGQGGSGICYTCNRNRCNSATSLAIGLASLLLPMTYFLMKF